MVVVGAGAIGATVGALLAASGARCVLVARGAHGRAMAERGVSLRRPDGGRVVRVPVVFDVEAAEVTARDLVIVATMGHDTDAAIASIDGAVTVASFQNGLAPIEAISSRRPCLAAMVYVPAERRAPGVVALPADPIGAVLVGDWPQGAGAWARWLARSLTAGGLRAESEGDVAPWVRAKLLTNLGGVVAALCDEVVGDVVEAARDEARAVWRAAGDRFEDIDALVARVGALAMREVDGVARVGGSTRAALARGDRLETRSLHGPVVARGREVGVPTPVNEALMRLADEAERDHARPGAMAAATLRARVYGRA